MFVHPSYSFKCPSVLTVLSIARITVVPTAHTFLPRSLARFTILTASSVTNICSESILCFVRSSTSISRKFPSPACNVIYAKSIPLISIRFISSRLKCRLAVGAVTAPSFLAKIDWKRSASSSSTGRFRIVCGNGVSPNAYNAFLNSS